MFSLQPQHQSAGGLFSSQNPSQFAEPTSSLFGSQQPLHQQQQQPLHQQQQQQPLHHQQQQQLPQQQQPMSNFGSWLSPFSLQQLQQKQQQQQQPGAAFGLFAGAGLPGTAADSALPPPEVRAIVSTLSNADARSCQILTDTFQRLKALLSNKDDLVAFSYELETDPQVLTQKKLLLERMVAQLGDPAICETHNNARRRNRDPSKYSIVAITGFEGFAARTAAQKRIIEANEKLVEDLKAQQTEIRKQLENQTCKRLSELSKRQNSLQSSLIRILGLLEDFAISKGRAQVDVAVLRRLQGDLTALSTELNGSAASRPSLVSAENSLHSYACSIGFATAGQDTETGGNSVLPSAVPGGTANPSRHGGPESSFGGSFRGPGQLSLSDADYRKIMAVIETIEIVFQKLSLSFRQTLERSKLLLAKLESQT